MAIDLNAIERYLCQIEQGYFTTGPFNENRVRDDLRYRPVYEFSQKKNFYIQDFNENLGYINKVLEWLENQRPLDTALISRCKKCKDQMNKLLGIVNSF